MIGETIKGVSGTTVLRGFRNLYITTESGKTFNANNEEHFISSTWGLLNVLGGTVLEGSTVDLDSNTVRHSIRTDKGTAHIDINHHSYSNKEHLTIKEI